MLLLLVLSCTEPPCPDGSIRAADGLCYLTDEEETTADTPEFGPLEPALTAEEAIAEMERALSWGLVDAVSIFDVYVSFLNQRDSDCPPMENKNAQGYSGVWATIEGETCTATTGYSYFGLALFFEEIQVSGDEFEGQVFTTDRWGYSMVASYELTDPDGYSFVGGGTAIHSWELLEDESIQWDAFIGGTFSYPPAGGWLGEGIDASLFMNGTLINGRRQASLQGGIGYPGVDISFEEFTYDSDVGHPQGIFRLRDSTDYWFSIELDADGCGPMTWRHLDLGEQCIDLTPAIVELLDTIEADPR